MLGTVSRTRGKAISATIVTIIAMFQDNSCAINICDDKNNADATQKVDNNDSNGSSTDCMDVWDINEDDMVAERRIASKGLSRIEAAFMNVSQGLVVSVG